MKIPGKLLATILASLGAALLNADAAVKIEEKIVGPAFSPGVVYTPSPKGMHVAADPDRNGKGIPASWGSVGGPQICESQQHELL